MPEIPPVSLALEQLGIPHRVFTHPGPVSSLEQAARERGHRPEQVVRSILFRLKEDEHLMLLVAGPAQVSWKALRKHLGQSRLTMAGEDEVLEVTGYPIGAVGPFGLPRKVRVLVDASVLVLLAQRTPIEESKLIERFGDDYRKYMERTGRFFPRLSRSAIGGNWEAQGS